MPTQIIPQTNHNLQFLTFEEYLVNPDENYAGEDRANLQDALLELGHLKDLTQYCHYALEQAEQGNRIPLRVFKVKIAHYLRGDFDKREPGKGIFAAEMHVAPAELNGGRK